MTHFSSRDRATAKWWKYEGQRRGVGSVLVAMTILFLTVTAEAKRGDPNLAEAVRYGGLEYRVSGKPERAGIVEVWDWIKGVKVRDIRVYRNFVWPWVEADTQWVFITGLKLDWPVLTVVNERGRIYRVRVDRWRY